MRQPDLSVPLGIVLRRTPSSSRWARWTWRAVAVLPGAGPAEWRELRREGEAVEFHAATLPLDLWRTDTAGYLFSLSARVPSVAVVMRPALDGPHPFSFVTVTASAHEAQDYADTGEEIVEMVPMPKALERLLRDFVAQHHREEEFVKRKRDRVALGAREQGIGDRRVHGRDDVYRAPEARRRAAP